MLRFVHNTFIFKFKNPQLVVLYAVAVFAFCVVEQR